MSADLFHPADHHGRGILAFCISCLAIVIGILPLLIDDYYTLCVGLSLVLAVWAMLLGIRSRESGWGQAAMLFNPIVLAALIYIIWSVR